MLDFVEMASPRLGTSSRRRFAPFRARSRSLALVLIFASTALGAGGRVYKNGAMRVRSFEPPAGWELAPAASYPRLLAAYNHPEVGRLTLTAQRVGAGVSAARLANEARAPLAKQGFTQVRITQEKESERVRLEAELGGGQRHALQLYIVDSGIGYVITMISPLAASARSVSDFDAAVRSLSLGVDPDEVPAPGRRPDAATPE